MDEERGIFDGLLRFARSRPDRPRPGVTAPQRPAEIAGQLRRLINVGIFSPYPLNEPATPEAEHEAAGGTGPQSSKSSRSVHPQTSEESMDSLAKGGASVSPTMTPELDLVSRPHVVMISPHRGGRSVIEADQLQPLTFSKEALISMNHGTHHLAIDVFRPAKANDVFTDAVFPLQDLSPLCLYHQLRSLSIVGMMQSYQSYIWLVVWLNPHLTELTLEMMNSGDCLDSRAIDEGWRYAKSKPTMREVSQGKSNGIISKKLPIVSLSLTNFVVDNRPFGWFAGDTMRHLRLHRCNAAGFRLPEELRDRVRMTITG